MLMSACRHLTLALVDPAHQGRGIGRALVQECVAKVDALSLPCYLQSTTIAVPLYEKLGFHEVAQIEMYASDEHNRKVEGSEYTQAARPQAVERERDPAGVPVYIRKRLAQARRLMPAGCIHILIVGAIGEHPQA